MGIHIKSLEIDGFKGIREFKLDHLNHINILTGDNNSGKTTVLELLSTIYAPQDIKSWIDTSRMNGILYEGIYYDALYNLFPVDYDLAKPIGYGYIDKMDKVHKVRLIGRLEETLVTSSEVQSLNGIRVGNKRNSDAEVWLETQCLHLLVEGTDFPAKEYDIYDFQKRLRFAVRKTSSLIKTVYVSPTAHAGRITLNEVLADVDMYDDLIRLLREFDENIVNIISIQKGESSIIRGTEYMILTKNHKKALPLSNYGDGMKKALLIVSAMLKAKGGILLLDEFETAIHTSAMDHIFSWLIKCAMDLNVQVFLTSHSKEAINKVLRCDEELKSKISYYTLYSYEGRNLVRYLSCEDAIIMQDQGGADIR
mgnify:CR=1 FL=1